MFNIAMEVASEQFTECWQAAGRFLIARSDTGSLNWMKVDLIPPIMEHMSFRVGNQLFFVRVVDMAGRVVAPGGDVGVRSIAEGCRGHACEMPMALKGGKWAPVLPGWGLRDLDTKKPIDPPSLVSDELIEMTDWEVHDFAIQVVRNHLEEEGRKLMSSPSDPAIFPSLWFVGDAGPEWVVIGESRYPNPPPEPPDFWDSIIEGCRPMSEIGSYAFVLVANGSEPFDGKPGSALPLWRGHYLRARFSGLIRG